MSSHEDAQVDRLDAAMRRFYATHRRSLRWWKRAREYVSLLRLLRNGLLRGGGERQGGAVPQGAGHTPAKDGIPHHPPWDARGWRWNTPDGKAPFRY